MGNVLIAKIAWIPSLPTIAWKNQFYCGKNVKILHPRKILNIYTSVSLFCN